MADLTNHSIIVTSVDVVGKVMSYTVDGDSFNIAIDVEKLPSAKDIQIMALKSSYENLVSKEKENALNDLIDGEYADIIGVEIDTDLYNSEG